jgi:adenine deaminase
MVTSDLDIPTQKKKVGGRFVSPFSVQTLRDRIRAAKGEIPAELVLKRGKVVNSFSGTIHEDDVAVYAGFIVGVGPDYHGNEEIDVRGKWITPGLIDGHIHVESSMLLPSRLAAALLPHGTTTIISDPHEIANVMGVDGIRLLIEDSRSIPFDIFFMASSCVPATRLETSGAQLGLSELKQLRNEPRILGLAEVMNYPGVLMGLPEVLEKLILFQDRIIDGHSPGLSGKDLQAYISVGIRSDHETSDRMEGAEKLKSGMMLMIREGTSAKNLKDLLPLVKASNSRRFCFVADDLHPLDIRRRGHLDFMVARAIELGLDPVTAVQIATLNPAEYFGLRERGVVAPGYRADLVVLKDLNRFEVERVYKNGIPVVEAGELKTLFYDETPSLKRHPLNMPAITPEKFRIRDKGLKARIIEVIEGQALTGVGYETVKSENGWVVSDIEADILKIAVVERHRGSGRVGLGLVRGIGLKTGALATSVAHDSHNVIVTGVDDRDIVKSIEEIRRMGGGLTVVNDDKVLASVPLELAGLISREPIERLIPQLEDLNRATGSLGCKLQDPFMHLSFLSLAVIPELKLTDMGLVDVNRSAPVGLFLGDRNSF